MRHTLRGVSAKILNINISITYVKGVEMRDERNLKQRNRKSHEKCIFPSVILALAPALCDAGEGTGSVEHGDGSGKNMQSS